MLAVLAKTEYKRLRYHSLGHWITIIHPSPSHPNPTWLFSFFFLLRDEWGGTKPLCLGKNPVLGTKAVTINNRALLFWLAAADNIKH